MDDSTHETPRTMYIIKCNVIIFYGAVYGTKQTRKKETGETLVPCVFKNRNAEKNRKEEQPIQYIILCMTFRKVIFSRAIFPPGGL